MPRQRKFALVPQQPNSHETLDEFKRLGCDGVLVYAAASNLSDWTWGTEKWRPPTDSKVDVLEKAADLLKAMEADFFFDILWNTSEDEDSRARLLDTQVALIECEIGILVVSEYFGLSRMLAATCKSAHL
jgi:hypothetical protein